MSIERERLLLLIEFAHQSARLRRKTAATVAEHGLFALHEHQVQGLPGIHLNVNSGDGEEELWLVVERLHETKPPEVNSPLLLPWLQMTQSPNEEPSLRETATGAALLAAGAYWPSAASEQPGKRAIDPDGAVSLSQFDVDGRIRALLATYLDTRWRRWAADEQLRRKTIGLYSKLFKLKQELEGNIVETQLELVWGAGVGVWNLNGAKVSYPLVTRLAEMSLDPVTASVEVRPRDVDAHIEVGWYASVDNLGVADLEEAAKEFLGKSTSTFSPFDRGTFEPLLRTAATNLDANGIYWPNEAQAEDRTLPLADSKLRVTDTWVLFARPRTNSMFLQDLDKLKKQAEDSEFFPPAVAAIVTDPETVNPVVDLPSFRGVSDAYESEGHAPGKDVRELYFPKAFNDEQVRIVQMLDVSDGVVVQGPPGTGKTHTIANVICHYLAEGKRVLVTSMKDPALAVLQEQLPEEIRPLAIALLTSEQEGMKQFERAINKIAAEVQSLDRSGTARAINHLAESIDALHGKLANVDRKIADWARRNLNKVMLETEEVEPQEAARAVLLNEGQFEWIPDALGIAPEFAPRFSDADVVQLREARRALGQDIDYIDSSLPHLVQFPDSKNLLEVHQDLSQFERLKREVEDGLVPALSDSSQETLALAQNLVASLEVLRGLRDQVAQSRLPWTAAVRERLRQGKRDDLLLELEALGVELEQVVEWRKSFLRRPVNAPAGIEFDLELAEAVGNLAEGKSAFGLTGLIGKSAQKKQLASILVLGSAPADAESWKNVAEHLALMKQLRLLALRWNALARELQLDTVPEDRPEGGLIAARRYGVYVTTKAVARAEAELCELTLRVFPNWLWAREVADSDQRLVELEKALRHHLTKNRLANVWVAKERFQKVLEGRTGRVIENLRQFLSKTLGDPRVEDSAMQAEWSALMTELHRVLGLGSCLATVRDVCDRVEASGSPQYAALLQQPLVGTVDGLLPDNWRMAWRLKRLSTHLESIDAREDLKRLGKDRLEMENDLSRAYRDVVVKRTWLKLAENASPRMRAALQAYLNAIQKIGKGTGKRAVRYRQDARMAASQANPAVPCWIMPHHRVSESLPAELGCFDLVIIDEASQSDLMALPSLLRAKKVLIVGDDKQVSPEGVGLEEEKIRSLMSRFLGDQVETYRPQMSPERSIYDLFKVVFAKSSVMLKEHFRCVAPIIEYSKREFYHHELRPLRIPKASERLDPPLIDVMVDDGFRRGDVNLPEARFIVDEIKSIVADPAMRDRSIGVVSLLGDKQALLVWDRLVDEVGPEVMQRHRVACGDARTFQGKERDIMFLSMVSAPNEIGAPLSRDTFAQRFNVAASRARDRMYLVRSVALENLSAADRLRRGLIAHFAMPFAQDEVRVEDLRTLCESPFERDMYDELTQRGYRVTPQVRVGQYRIDMVVEGHNDARLAVECDGDQYHGADKWSDDMQRQRVLERAGWVFWRCFASAFIRRRREVIEDLLMTLAQRGVEPIGAEASRSVHTEHRSTSESEPVPTQTSMRSPETVDDTRASAVQAVRGDERTEEVWPDKARSVEAPAAMRIAESPRFSVSSGRTRDSILRLENYVEYAGPPGNDPRSVHPEVVALGILRIVEVEGPVVGKRAYDIYLRSCGINRMGHELKSAMNKALAGAIRQRQVVSEHEAVDTGFLFSVIRASGSPPIKLRTRGPRSFEEIPPSELQVVARYLAETQGFLTGSDGHLHAVLECFDLKRLTVQVSTTLREILERRFPHVDEFMRTI